MSWATDRVKELVEPYTAHYDVATLELIHAHYATDINQLMKHVCGETVHKLGYAILPAVQFVQERLWDRDVTRLHASTYAIEPRNMKRLLDLVEDLEAEINAPRYVTVPNYEPL